MAPREQSMGRSKQSTEAYCPMVSTETVARMRRETRQYNRLNQAPGEDLNLLCIRIIELIPGSLEGRRDGQLNGDAPKTRLTWIQERTGKIRGTCRESIFAKGRKSEAAGSFKGSFGRGFNPGCSAGAGDNALYPLGKRRLSS